MEPALFLRAGMARARAQGKRASRSTIADSLKEKIARLYRDGKPVNQIRKELGVSYGTAWNYV